VGWASRPSWVDGRDAHPTFKSGSYLILISNPVASELFLSVFSPSAFSAPSAVKSFRYNRKRYHSLEAIFYDNNRPIDDSLTVAPTYIISGNTVMMLTVDGWLLTPWTVNSNLLFRSCNRNWYNSSALICVNLPVSAVKTRKLLNRRWQLIDADSRWCREEIDE